MLTSRATKQTELSLETFNEFNKAVFYNDNIPPEDFTPLTNAPKQYITQAELTDILKFRFKANKSSGLSKMPLEVLKHLGPAGIGCVAEFLNTSAID